MSFNIDWGRFNRDLQRLSNEKKQKIELAINVAVERGARKVEAQIVQNINSQGISDTGDLVGSIDVKKKSGSGTNVIYEVYTNNPYAQHVEFGTRPHRVSPMHLKDWARRKLGDESLAFPIAKKISRTGTVANPFFRKAYYQKKEEVQRDIKNAIKKALKE